MLYHRNFTLLGGNDDQWLSASGNSERVDAIYASGR
jgi:hypothetical protein